MSYGCIQRGISQKSHALFIFQEIWLIVNSSQFSYGFVAEVSGEVSSHEIQGITVAGVCSNRTTRQQLLCFIHAGGSSSSPGGLLIS